MKTKTSIIETQACNLLKLAGLSVDEIGELGFWGYFYAPASKSRHLAVPGGLMRQEKRKRGEMLRDNELKLYRSLFGYGKFCKVTKFSTCATRSDWLELMAKFEVLKAAYKQQQKNFYLAFLIANDLLLDPDDDTPEPTPEEMKDYRAATFMSMGIERTSLHPQLENMEV